MRIPRASEPEIQQQPPVNFDDGKFGPENPSDFQQEPQPNKFDGIDPEGGFDAGVEANEEIEPKKYIQQLTGKLSQSLRSYNKEMGTPDVDLNKYVCGMVIKQAVSGLSQEDVDDILSKLKSNETSEEVDDNSEENGEETTEEALVRELSHVKRDTEEPSENEPFNKKPFSKPKFD